MKSKEKEYQFLVSVVIRFSKESALKSQIDRNQLLTLFYKPDNKEALFLSSHNLHSELITLLENNISPEKVDSKIIRSLLKYHQRISSRCTPFGLFGACGTLVWGNNNQIEIPEKFKRNTRLDMHYSVALSQHLSIQPYIKPFLIFFPNSSIYKSAYKQRYVEYFYKNNNRIHQLSEVDSSIYLETILSVAEKGLSLDELARTILSEEISFEDARTFLDELVSSQVLISELEPSVTGAELMTQMREGLQKNYEKNHNEELSKIIAVITKVLNQLKKIDEKIGNDLSSYQVVFDLLDEIGLAYDKGKLFQTDLFIDSKVNKKMLLDSSIQNDLHAAIQLLNKLTAVPHKNNLTNFIEAFQSRYEDKFVPLLDALDNESGIGYANNRNQSGDVGPLVEGIHANHANANTEITWNKRQSFLFNKLLAASKNSLYSIELNLNELKDFTSTESNLPDSISVMFSVLNAGEKPSKILFKGASGSSAANLLGRFASGDDEIFKLSKEITDREAELNPTKILAEICHLPENRAGNILLRPHLRDFEIPFLSKSTLPSENQLNLNDLLIGVKNNKIILWSKKHQKEVLPRMSNAHNYSANALPVYHFLCDIQTQGVKPGLSFDWGNLQSQFSFLPRVEMGNVILFPATWQLKKDDFADLLSAKEDILYAKIEEWKVKWKLPNRFYIADGDNELLIHLHESDPLLVKLFLSEIKNRPSVILKEFLFDLDNPLVKSKDGGGYTNEFVAALIRKTKVEDTNHYVPSFMENPVQRKFALGSEWLYFKIYSGVKTSDAILTGIVIPLCSSLLEEGVIDCWFFIRYSDPDSHIRLRFHVIELTKIGIVLSRLHEQMDEYIENGLIAKLQADTYSREIERYGEHSMQLAEELFFYDSIYVLNFLENLSGEHAEEMRWLFALRSLDELLNDFNYSLEHKIDFLNRLRENFKQEFKIEKGSQIQMDNKFREKRKQIEEVMLPISQLDEKWHVLTEQLNQRSENNKKCVEQIISNCNQKLDNLTLDNLLSSYAHMHMNRIFRSKQRMSEMMIYDFLCRYHTSAKAKMKKK